MKWNCGDREMETDGEWCSSCVKGEECARSACGKRVSQVMGG